MIFKRGATVKWLVINTPFPTDTTKMF